MWTSYVTTFGVDGFRVDCGVVAWWPAMDRIVLAAHEAGGCFSESVIAT